MYWSVRYLSRQQWKPLFILDQIRMKKWKKTKTQTSKNSRICSISPRAVFVDSTSFCTCFLRAHLSQSLSLFDLPGSTCVPQSPGWPWSKEPNRGRVGLNRIAVWWSCSSSWSWETRLWATENTYTEIDIGTWCRNSERITDRLDSFLMDEIYAYARSSNQADESISTRLLRFRLMLGENARAFRSESKMECSTRRISTVQLLRWIIWNGWRTDCVRVECFPRLASLEILQQTQRSPARSKHWTWKCWRTDHLHVNVQWHRLDAEKKSRKTPNSEQVSVQGHECFSREILNKWQMYHTLQCEFSIYGAVSNWCDEFPQRTPNQEDSTMEKFAAKENEQLLKKCEAEKEELFGANPKSDNGASANRCRECLQRIETLEKEIQFTRVCEDATFARRVSIEMRYWTIPDVDDGFGDRTPVCREYTLPSRRSKFQNQCNNSKTNYKQLEQFFNFISHDNLTSADLKFRFIPQKRKIEHPRWIYVEVKTATWRRYISMIQTESHKFWIAGAHTVGKPCCKRKRTWFHQYVAKKLMRNNWRVRRIQFSNFYKKLFLWTKRSGMTFLLINISENILLKAKSQNWQWAWYVVVINTKGKQTAFIGNRWVKNFEKRFRRLEGKNSRTLIGSECLQKKQQNLQEFQRRL